MKTFDQLPFDHPTQVSHQGRIIAFAVASQDDPIKKISANDICYRVLDVTPEVPQDEDNWSPLQKVSFPEVFQPVGIELIRVPKLSSHTYEGTPFSVLSDGRHVYIFRQSKGGTLLVSRFLLLEVLDEERGEQLPTLQVPWEVRYQRSRKPSLPASDKDGIGFKDMEGTPFLEPTFELTAIDQLTKGWFDVLIFPTDVPNEERWQIFSVNETTQSIRISSLLRSQNGLFLLDTLEEQSLQLNQDGKPLYPVTGIASLLYFQQVKDIDDYGREQILKRNGRLMLAMGVSDQKEIVPRQVAALNFSGAESGFVNETSISSGAFPFENALQLGLENDEKIENPEVTLSDGSNTIVFESTSGSYVHSGSYVAFDQADMGCTFDPWSGTIELWVKFPKRLPQRSMALVGFSGHDQYNALNNLIGFYWLIDTSRKFQVYFGSYNDEGKVNERSRLFDNKAHKAIPENVLTDGKYHHLAVSFAKDAQTGKRSVTFYLDGNVHQSIEHPSDGWTSTGGLWGIGCHQIKAENIDSPRKKGYYGPYAVDRFKGWIADVAVWNEAKDGDFIRRRTNNKLTGDEAHLAGYFPVGTDTNVDSLTNVKTKANGKIHGKYAIERIDASTGGLIQEPKSPTTLNSYLSFTETSLKPPQFSASGGVVELWLKTTKTARQALVDFSGSAARLESQRGMGLVLFLEENRLVLRHGYWAKQVRSSESKVNLSDGKWHHIALRFEREDTEGSNYSIIFEVDGSHLSTQSGNTLFETNADTSGYLRGIGYRLWNNQPSQRADPFKGQMALIRIWDTAKKSAEISQNSRQEVPADAPGLISYFDFSEAVGQKVKNQAVSRLHKDLVGTIGAGVTFLAKSGLTIVKPVLPAPMAVLDWMIESDGRIKAGDGHSTLQPLADSLAVPLASAASYLLPPATTQSTPSLLEGADGLLHLYFAGEQNGLSVAQYRPLLEKDHSNTDNGTDESEILKIEPIDSAAKNIAVQSSVPSGITFDGQTNYVELGVLPIGSSFTIEMWINPQSIYPEQAFIAKHRDDGSNLFLFGYRPGGIHVELNRLDGKAEHTEGEKKTGLQHLAVTVQQKDATSSEVSTYRNGLLVWTKVMNTVINDWRGKPWVVGLDWDRDQAPSEWFLGQLFELHVWDTPKTPSEIKAGFQQTPPADAPHLAASYLFEKGEDPLQVANRKDPSKPATLRSSSKGAEDYWGELMEKPLPPISYLDLNGEDEYVELTDFSLGSSFTVEAWVNPRTTDGKQVFLAKHNASSRKSLLNFGYRPNGVHVELNGAQEFAGGEKLTGWQHLAVVVRKLSVAIPGQSAQQDISLVTVLRNGRPLWQRNFYTVVEDWSGRSWLIGQEWDGNAPSDFLDGQISEVRFWDHARSFGEIANGMFQPPAADTPGLLGLYLADKGQDPTILEDKTGSGKDGALKYTQGDPNQKWGQFQPPPGETTALFFPMVKIVADGQSERWWRVSREAAAFAETINGKKNGSGSALIKISKTADRQLPKDLSLKPVAQSGLIQGQWIPQAPGLALELDGSSRIDLDGLLDKNPWPLDLQRAMTIETWVRPSVNTNNRLKILHLDQADDSRLSLGILPDGNGSVSIHCAGLLGDGEVSIMHQPDDKRDEETVTFPEALYPSVSFDPNASNQAHFRGEAGTVEFWMKTKATDTLSDGSVRSSDRQCLLAFNAQSDEDAISIYLENNRLGVRRENGNLEAESEEFGKDQRPDLMDGDWHHIAIRFFSDPNDSYRIECLVEDATYPMNANDAIFDKNRNIRTGSGGLKSIGGHRYTLGGGLYTVDGQTRVSKSRWIEPFKGNLGEIRIWNKKRTKTEILASLLALNGDKTGLTGHYIPANVKVIELDDAEYDIVGAIIKPKTKVYKLFNEVHSTSEALAGTLGKNTKLERSNDVAVYAGNQSNASIALGLTLTENRWMHLAAAYRSSYSLVFDGKLNNFIDCGNNLILKAPKELSLEAWVRPAKDSKISGTLLSKMSPGLDERGYQLFIDSSGFVHFEIHTSEEVDFNNEKTKKITLRSDAGLPDDQWNHIAVTCQATTDTKTQSTPEGGVSISPQTLLVLKLYINGTAQRSFVSQSFPVDLSFQTNDAPLWIGRSSDAWRSDYFTGEVGTVRAWGRPLSAKEVTRTIRLRKVADNTDKLYAHWMMESGKGLTLYDAMGINHGRISHTGMWRISDLKAGWSLFVNGKKLKTLAIAPAEAFSGSTPQFSLGGLAGNKDQSFKGVLDDLRIWSVERTEEEIADSMYRELTGDEKALAAYWKFNTARKIVDRTDHFAALKSLPASWWTTTDAPVGNEGPGVQNIIQDSPKETQSLVNQTPSASEYGDMQFDANGKLFGVLKRLYLYRGDDGKVVLRTGFKVGDLDMCYIGQVQTAPTLVGYIEGAPPVPSENLTVNDPVTDDYVGASKIELVEAANTVSVYSSSSNKGSHTNTEYTVGGLLKKEISLGSPVSSSVVLDLEMKSGYLNQVEVSTGTLHQSGIKTGSTKTITRALDLVGSWEEKGKELYPEVGRRYVPANVGYALVKSRTSDLYALKLKNKNTIIAYETLINPDIPEDWNIIMFKINPEYTENGTLDGNVGDHTLEGFKNADVGQRSYFRPKEAYALKEEIQREREELLALYEQFDAVQKGKSNDERELLSERWKNKIAQRSMVNTYVWTADGGMYAEEESTLSVRTESIGGTYARKFVEGLQIEGQFAVAGIGAFGSYDSLSGQYQNFTVMKEKEEARSFSLQVNLTGEGFLKKWSNEDDPGREDPNGTYLSEDAPGKVSAYRFMTFYLSPQKNYFDLFFAKVVDGNWLKSDDPNAKALREAKGAKNGVWRVLHRVTYVNRITPQIPQPMLAETADRKIVPAINQEQNQTIIDFAKQQLAARSNLEATDLVAATEHILTTDLKTTTTWFSKFWEEADDRTKQELHKDVLRYLRNYYGIE